MQITRNSVLCICSFFIGTFALTAQQAPPPVPPAVHLVNPAAIPQVTDIKAAPKAPDTTGGKIQFETSVFDFGRVRAGEPVKHTYVFTNIGCGTLEVTHVQPSCGCTTAGDWTHKVEPGSNGTVTVQFNSANFNGPVIKTITVTSTDKAQPQTVLQLKGTIWKPIDVVPQFAVLNVPPDTGSASAVVRIVNNMEDPMSLSDMTVNNKAFTAELTTNQLGKEYQVVVSTVPPLPQGNVQGLITFKSSNTNMPVVTVNVWANIQPAIVVSPPQLMIAPGPLQAKTGHTLMIINNSTNKLTLSEPTINVPNVTTEVKEIQPGKQFSITLGFPQGFEMPPGQPVLFSVKTSNPQTPLIKVAVTQMPRPMQPIVKPVANIVPSPQVQVAH